MKKSFFKRLMLKLKAREKHISKSQRFGKLVDNPVGRKFRKACDKSSRRRADGTLRSSMTVTLRDHRV